MSELETFLTTGVFAFLLTFVRVGTAVMIMPGIGNTFVPPNIRLFFALGFSFVMFPFLQANLPTPLPNTASLFLLIGIEFLIGFFIGTITRVLMSALDVAGMIISTQSSLANAQLFNPAFSSQGSIVGTFLTLVAVLMLFATDLHHLLILAVANSYELFPFGKIPDAGSMSQSMVEIISKAFMIGVQLTAPFLLLVFLMYIAMAVMSKLMPQVQVFMIAIPLQIIISLIILAMVGSAMMLAWLHSYQKGLEGFLQAAGG